LRFFDQIRFFPVTAEELKEARAAFPFGKYPLRIEHTELSFADYAAGLARDGASIAVFKQRQQAAFVAERLRWKEANIDAVADQMGAAPKGGAEDLPEGSVGIFSEVPGCVWKVLVDEGAKVVAGDPVAIVESMKMEIAIAAPDSGRVSAIRVKPGQVLAAGDVIALVEPA
jgi:urea carboxylase